MMSVTTVWIQWLSKPSLLLMMSEAGVEVQESEAIDDLCVTARSLVRKGTSKETGVGNTAVLGEPVPVSKLIKHVPPQLTERENSGSANVTTRSWYSQIPTFQGIRGQARDGKAAVGKIDRSRDIVCLNCQQKGNLKRVELISEQINEFLMKDSYSDDDDISASDEDDPDYRQEVSADSNSEEIESSSSSSEEETVSWFTNSQQPACKQVHQFDNRAWSHGDTKTLITRGCAAERWLDCSPTT
ncbi:hypothetical protein PR048_026573 [Dryococelus australis]|uniref:Uncharacterized protein n=1 Tax=Dryococelus australis TaxID=614101 RepID=A0ABQ9GLP3_9NEOP|nr:hypothetical protein PR048_026573 [Dryococelus australis]